MNRVVSNFARLGQRQLSTTTSVQAVKGEVHPGYEKIKEKYKKFQVDDGVPVHLKGGPMDKVLYYLTIAGCLVGFVGVGDFIYGASFPKKC